jgi:hypothetical protein
MFQFQDLNRALADRWALGLAFGFLFLVVAGLVPLHG